MRKYKNTKKQGDMGLGVAIGYFARQGITIALPLTDSQEYDLIIDLDGKLHRIQVKTTTYKRQYYEVNLNVKGGNRSSKGTLKSFDSTRCDDIFIVTPQAAYLIPACDAVIKGNLTLTPRYDRFKLFSSDLSALQKIWS